MIRVYKSEKAKRRMYESYDTLLEAWEAEHREIDLDTRYGTTHCILAGDEDRPPLLLFHGVGDNSAVMWILDMKELSRHFRCIAADTIGGPGKSVPNQRYGEDFDPVCWIEELSDRLEIPRCSVVGVSYGAHLAFSYTVERPERVRKTVCLEGGIVTSRWKPMIRTLALLFPEILLPTHGNMVRILRKMLSPDSDIHIRHPEVVEHMILAMRSHRRSAMFRHKLRPYDEQRALEVRDRLLFLVGAHRIARKQPFVDLLSDGGYRYEVIEGADHAINHEQPERVDAEILRFLGDS